MAIAPQREDFASQRLLLRPASRLALVVPGSNGFADDKGLVEVDG